MKAHPLFPYFLEKRLAIPTSPFFHLLVIAFVLLVSVFLTTPYLPYIGGQYRWAGRNLNGISQRIISIGASKDLILVHTVQLKSMKKAHSSGRMVSSGISDVVIYCTLRKPSEEVDDDDENDSYYNNFFFTITCK